MAFGLAGGLELLEQGEVLLQAAIDALLIEGQELDAFGFACEGSGGGKSGVELGMVDVNVAGMVEETEGEDVVFNGARAVETPRVGGDALCELELECSFRGHGFD